MHRFARLGVRDREFLVLLLRRCQREREIFIDNLLVRIHSIIVMIWWTGLAPWELALYLLS